MEEKRLMTMEIASSILTSYYCNKVCFCVVNGKEPDALEKEDLLKKVVSMFENLSTSYLSDIEEIAAAAR